MNRSKFFSVSLSVDTEVVYEVKGNREIKYKGTFEQIQYPVDDDGNERYYTFNEIRNAFDGLIVSHYKVTSYEEWYNDGKDIIEKKFPQIRPTNWQDDKKLSYPTQTVLRPTLKLYTGRVNTNFNSDTYHYGGETGTVQTRRWSSRKCDWERGHEKKFLEAVKENKGNVIFRHMAFKLLEESDRKTRSEFTKFIEGCYFAYHYFTNRRELLSNENIGGLFGDARKSDGMDNLDRLKGEIFLSAQLRMGKFENLGDGCPKRKYAEHTYVRCSICGSVSANQTDMKKRHHDVKHPGMPYVPILPKCTKCSREFANTPNFVRHLKYICKIDH